VSSAASRSGARHRITPKVRLIVTVGSIALVAVGALAGFLLWHGAWAGRLHLATVRAALAGPRVVAITVDDGPTAAYTPRVLALLKSHGATATFFVVGKSAQQHPDLVRAALAQGCTIGVHTWSHPKMDRISDVRARAEVLRGAEAVEKITGEPPLFYRPPRGVSTPVEGQAVSDLGMHIVLWDQCLDHVGDKTPAAAAERVLERIVPGDIILLHDGAGDREKTIKALGILLDGLESTGYRVVPLGQLPL